MIGPISFQGTFRTYNTKNNSTTFYELNRYIYEKGEKNDNFCQETQYVHPDKNNYPKINGEEYRAISTLVVPKLFDSVVEKYCIKNNIPYKKIGTKDDMTPEKITSRIITNDKNGEYFLATVNNKKLNSLLKNQRNNFEMAEYDYQNIYKKETDFMFKNLRAIPAPCLTIRSLNTSFSDALLYLRNNGNKNIDPEYFDISLIQKDEKRPDYCGYFAQKEFGIDNPVVKVDTETFAIGEALGIFE